MNNIKLDRFLTFNYCVLISVFSLLVTLSFKRFYFFNPFEFGFTVLGAFQTMLLIGWIIILIFPLLISQQVKLRSIILYPLILIFPISWILIRITLLISFGELRVNYLFNYPIFIFTDIFVPIYYLFYLKNMKFKKEDS